MVVALYLAGGALVVATMVGFILVAHRAAMPRPAKPPAPAPVSESQGEPGKVGLDPLLELLPSVVPGKRRRRTRVAESPGMAEELLHEVHGWLISAAATQDWADHLDGCGYPSGAEYVEQQRCSIAAFRALEKAFGAAPVELTTSVRDHEETYIQQTYIKQSRT